MEVVMKKKPTSELEFDLAALRDIKRLLNRVVGKTLIYEKAIKRRIRLAAEPPAEVIPPLPVPELSKPAELIHETTPSKRRVKKVDPPKTEAQKVNEELGKLMAPIMGKMSRHK